MKLRFKHAVNALTVVLIFSSPVLAFRFYGVLGYIASYIGAMTLSRFT